MGNATQSNDDTQSVCGMECVVVVPYSMALAVHHNVH